MGFFNQFPYTNFHELNLDWIIKTIKKYANYEENAKKAEESAKEYAQQAADIVENAAEDVQGIVDEARTAVAEAEEEANKSSASAAESAESAALARNAALGGKILFIGDSYGTGFNPDGATLGWIHYAVEKLNNIQHYKTASNGAGYTVAGNTFLGMMEAAANDIEDKEYYTRIVVCGGYNDKNEDSDTIRTAVDAFVTRARELFPYATVFVTNAGWSTNPNYRDAVAAKVLPALKSSRGVYLNGVEYVMHDYRRFSSDGTHPTSEGAKAIGYAVANALYGDYSETFIPHQLTCGNVAMTEQASGGFVQLLFARGARAVSIATLASAVAVKLGNYNSNYIRGRFGNFTAVTVPVNIVHRDGTTKTMLSIVFRDGYDDAAQNGMFIQQTDAVAYYDVTSLNFDPGFATISMLTC